MRLGFHISISKGFRYVPERALSLGCDTFQMFSGNPRGWKKKLISTEDVEGFKEGVIKHKLHPVIVHSSYLPRINSVNKDLRKRSIASLITEIKRAEVLSANYFIIHFTPKQEEIELFKDGLSQLHSEYTKILLENTASSRFKVMGEVLKHLPSIGLCLDTAHSFESGYDLRDENAVRDMFSEIQDFIGIERLKCIHLNDSKTQLGSKIDRHWHIGKGYIGEKGFLNLLSYPGILSLPGIMETPVTSECGNAENMKQMRHLSNMAKAL